MIFKRKRVLSLLCALVLLCGIILNSEIKVKASGGEPIDGSYLTHQESSVGKAVQITRGAYLMTGDCSVSKAGRGRVYAYASTTANKDVDYVGVVVYVEQYDEETEGWGQIDCWTVEDTDTYYVSTSKTVLVERGYFYRVRADHIAGPEDGEKDFGVSATDGIKVD